MASAQRPSRKSKDAAIAGLHNLTRRRQPHHAPEEDDVDKSAGIDRTELHQPESDSDFESVERPTRSVAKHPRRAAADASTLSTGKRQRRAPKEGGTTRKKQRTEATDGEGSLFEIVKSGKTALNTVVDEWIEAYKQDRDAALLELIQFFIHCSGCRGRITPHMYHNMEHADIIRKMTEEFDEESGDYPLIMTGPAFKKFKSNFCEFIYMLVHQCQYSIIYDQYMMDNVISLLTGLTDSQVRAFRHTSTLASMKLMTALVDVALNVSVSLDHIQRQYDAERSKSKGKQASDRLENLMEKRKEAEENQEEIRHMLTYIFKGVFVHRYRDSQAEIRGICTTEIGVWMKNYPGMFLDDSYLKYIGWTLYDRVGDVRLCCLRCLQPLYDSEELAPKMELFTNRFKDRIVEMTLDKEYDVAVQAVKLVISILKYNAAVLSDKDCENVYELVYSSHRGVAQAAGEFLNAKLFAHELDDATKNMKTKKGKTRSENTNKIRDLVLFFIESELHEHGSYLVDSLWEINDMLKDWECMTDLLLEEPGPGEEALDDRQETSLIEIMVCCVKQAATGEYPVGRGAASRRPTTKESRQVTEDKSKLTEHFIVTLPQLLARYMMDEEKVANLLQIPLYFDLEIYVSSRQEKNLDLLLRYIANIVEKHSDSEVLENSAKVLECFIGDANSIKSRCLTARDTLVDQLVERYRQAIGAFDDEAPEPDEDEVYNLMVSLKRLYAFWSCHDLNPWMLWESHSHLACATQNIPEEILCKTISCCHLSIIWQLEALDHKNPSKEGMKALQKCLARFLGACTNMLDNYTDIRQEEAYLCICDMLIIFSHSMAVNSPELSSLVYDAKKDLQQKLMKFLNDKVFIEDEDDTMDENKKIEELHKRRNFLASFCKLIVYNVIKIKCATDMFKYYMKFYNDYGDIIKATLGKAREINKVHTAKALAGSLTQLYRVLQDEQPVVERNSEGFLSIKELARRFSLSFGLDQVKNREAVAAMHKEGIQFVVSTGSYPFLEILTEFSGKLMKQDKKVVLAYLDSRMKEPVDPGSENYAPLTTYRNSLLMGEGDTTVQASRLAAPTTGTGRRGRAKRKLNVEADESTTTATTTTTTRIGGRTPRHNTTAATSHSPITATFKRPHIEPESASDVEPTSEQEYESLHASPVIVSRMSRKGNQSYEKGEKVANTVGQPLPGPTRLQSKQSYRAVIEDIEVYSDEEVVAGSVKCSYQQQQRCKTIKTCGSNQRSKTSLNCSLISQLSDIIEETNSEKGSIEDVLGNAPERPKLGDLRSEKGVVVNINSELMDDAYEQRKQQKQQQNMLYDMPIMSPVCKSSDSKRNIRQTDLRKKSVTCGDHIGSLCVERDKNDANKLMVSESSTSIDGGNGNIMESEADEDSWDMEHNEQIPGPNLMSKKKRLFVVNNDDRDRRELTKGKVVRKAPGASVDDRDRRELTKGKVVRKAPGASVGGKLSCNPKSPKKRLTAVSRSSNEQCIEHTKQKMSRPTRDGFVTRLQSDDENGHTKDEHNIVDDSSEDSYLTANNSDVDLLSLASRETGKGTDWPNSKKTLLQGSESPIMLSKEVQSGQDLNISLEEDDFVDLLLD